MFRRLERQDDRQPEWSRNGTLVNKPARGWLHPDSQLLPHAGVIYGVRYIGCMEVKESMKTLDFDTRTCVAKESISQVCEAAGLKSTPKRPKKSVRILRILGDQPNLLYAGSNVNLTITTEGLMLTIMESGEIIVYHTMPTISFASGGDPDTMDFVAYVAKDETFGRACHVLECGGGMAQDVITTIGQAFELRYKQHLQQRPEVHIPQRYSTGFNPNVDSWGDENDYYNDRPGAKPPSPAPPPGYDGSPRHSHTMSAASSVDPLLTCDKKDLSLIDLSDRTCESRTNGHTHISILPPSYQVAGATGGELDKNSSIVDAFDMKPFGNSLPRHDVAAAPPASKMPYHEMWFHGTISRQECETLLRRDGDFLVRESGSTPGQFVLSGHHGGRIRHLLLVDPQGVVRTKDQTFDSVSHLVNYHLENRLPIVSNDSEVTLLTPVIKT